MKDPTGTSDLRGIDVSLAYDDRKLSVVEARSHVVHFRYQTRDIFEVVFELVETSEQLIVIASQWPPRRQGRLGSQPLRIAVAENIAFLVRDHVRVDSITYGQLRARNTIGPVKAKWETPVLLMDDFNDEPFDIAVVDHLSRNILSHGALAGSTAGRRSSCLERRARLRKGGPEVIYHQSASKRRGPARLAILSLLAISVGAVLWAGGAAASSQGSQATNLLRIGITGAPDTFDPTLMGDNRSIELAQNVFEGVLDVDNQARIVPGVAKSWTVSKNKLVYTFHLRKGVRFQDGSPLTADDYVYTFNRSLDPKVGSGTSFFLEPIKGAPDVLKGKTKKAVGIRALDPLTLQVTLASPAGFFPATISRWSAWAVDQQVIDKFGADWVKPPNNIGSGAYRLVEQSGDQRYVFEANPTYRQGKPKIDRVEVSVVPDSTAALARYEAGELDIVVNLGVASVLKVKSDSKLRSQFHTRPIMRTVWLAMRNDKPPFNNKEVRQAFNLAIDKAALVKVALAGEATVANSWLPPGLGGNIVQQTRKSTVDVERAQKLLAQAGYPRGEGFPSIDLTYTINIGLYPEVFQLVQAQLERNLGVKVGLKQLPPRAFGALIEDPARRPPLFGYTFGFDYPDAQELTQYLGMSTAPFNVDGYKDLRYDKVVAKANVSGNQQQRAALYRQSERIRVADAASVPLYFVHNNWLVKPYVRGFGFGPLYMTKWREASIAK